MRVLVAGLIVIGLALGIWALWPGDEPGPATTTTALATSTTTTTTPPSTTVAPASTIGSTMAGHVVATTEEAEAILRDLWFGWFEGIYNQDEERIKEVVGTQALLDSARNAFGELEFTAAPSPDGIRISDVEILRADETCAALWVTSHASFLPGQLEPLQSVEILRWSGDNWFMVSSWKFKNDLWESDCESLLQPLQ